MLVVLKKKDEINLYLLQFLSSAKNECVLVFYLNAYMYTMCMTGTLGGQKKASEQVGAAM